MKEVWYPFFSSDISKKMGGSFESTFTIAKGIQGTFEPRFIFSGAGRASRRASKYGLSFSVMKYNSEGEGDNWVKSKIRLLEYIRRARNLIKKEKPSIIHVNDPISMAVWGAASKFTGTPLLWTVRGEYIDNKFKLAEKVFVDYLAFVSESTKNEYKRVVEKENKVIYNGVDLELFEKSSGSKLRRELGIPENSFLIGFVGSLVKRKRPLLFVDSIVETIQDNEHIHGVLVGEKKNEAILENINKKIKKNNVVDKFHILGYRDDIPDILVDLDLIVLPSKRRGEAFPRVPLEAMAAETPVLATDVSGVSEVITDVENGVLMGKNPSPIDIKNCVIKVYKDEELYDKLSIKGKEIVKERFSMEKTTENFAKFYKKIS